MYSSWIEVLPRKNCFGTSQHLGEGVREEGALPTPSHSQVQIQRRKKLQQIIKAEAE